MAHDTQSRSPESVGWPAPLLNGLDACVIGRVDASRYILTAILFLPLALGYSYLAIARPNSQTAPVALFLGLGWAGISVYLRLMYLRVFSDKFRYFTPLRGVKEIAYADVTWAGFLPVQGKGMTLAKFVVKTSNGMEVFVNVKVIQLRAIAALFAMLQASGIEIEIPPIWVAQYLFRTIEERIAKENQDFVRGSDQ